MKKFVYLLIGCLLPSLALSAAQDLTPNEILERLDQNLTSEQMVSISSFIIHGPRGSRTLKAKTWTQ